MIRLFRASNFRCLENAELGLGPAYNLIHGANASGKTSLLEALAYLGRGKSFRGASTQNLIRHGESEFVLFGELGDDGARMPVGVRNSRHGLEVRVGGENAAGAAALAQALPLQIIDPEVHSLIAGGPEQRRRFLDWIAFHVEHEHLVVWRRFRRVLKQRNAALKSGAADGLIRSWNAEFLGLALELDDSRRRVLAIAMASLQEMGEALLGTSLEFSYQQGWAREKSLEEALADGLARDRQLGSSQSGPHRADIKIGCDERQARKLVSRGQQKLLASAMILAATETVQVATERPLLLLLDDPAAELDADSIARLMARVAALGCQVVVTALDPKALQFPERPIVFHVEQGQVSRE